LTKNSKDMVDTNSKDMVDTFLMEEVRYALGEHQDLRPSNMKGLRQLKAVRCYGELKIRAAAYKLQKTPKGGSNGYSSDPQY
jgi:hypothetical protein